MEAKVISSSQAGKTRRAQVVIRFGKQTATKHVVLDKSATSFKGPHPIKSVPSLHRRAERDLCLAQIAVLEAKRRFEELRAVQALEVENGAKFDETKIEMARKVWADAEDRLHRAEASLEKLRKSFPLEVEYVLN